MRIILNCRRDTSIKYMLETLKWIKVEDMLQINALIFVHKIKLGLAPEYLMSKLTKFTEVHNYNTRNNTNFMLDHKKTKAAQNSVFFRAVQEYNKLTTNAKDSTLERFKKLLVEKYRCGTMDQGQL
ncbi:hypothetical protein WA026_021411 [Henosepilachna vigintioctopunctata]|uniref:Uncharacterized protein n=1 Tax=Henosepilachna vigintioctopunctata TaxID=420089 RepID=A0AAW1TWT2_9CUCU